MTKSQETADFNLFNPVHCLALGFGSGLLRPAPGTWGTLVGALIIVLIASQTGTQSLAYFTICAVISLAGIYICGKAAEDVGLHDHGAIVWDEIAGIFVTLAFVPYSITALVVGFVLFRLFDIVKPWPISWLDAKVGGGFGIMIDDIIAAVYAGLLLYACWYFDLLNLLEQLGW